MDNFTRRKYLAQIKRKFVNDCVSRHGCRINTTEPNQMILVSFFSEDSVLSDEIKYAIFSNIKLMKIERSAFGGTPGIVCFIGYDPMTLKPIL